MNTVSPAALDDLHRRVGRNLLRFQQIEFHFKFCLPYIHPKGSKSGLEALKKYRVRIRGRPLGEVVKALEESAEIDPDFFTHKLKDIVDARNELVHHFFEIPGIDLTSPMALGDLTKYLEQQYAATTELFDFALQLSSATLLALRDSHPGAYPELEALAPKLQACLTDVEGAPRWS